MTLVSSWLISPRNSKGNIGSEGVVYDAWLSYHHNDPIKFWALNANSFKIAKDTNFKFGTRDPRDSHNMDPEKFVQIVRGQGHVTS